MLMERRGWEDGDDYDADKSAIYISYRTETINPSRYLLQPAGDEVSLAGNTQDSREIAHLESLKLAIFIVKE